MLRYSFRDFISYMKDGSGKAASCLSASDMIGPIDKWHYSCTWAEDEANRLDPENEFCLSATYDAAFERHLISFDEYYRLIVSKDIKDHYTDLAAKSYFIKLEGGKMSHLAKYLPSQTLLEKHSELVAQ